MARTASVRPVRPVALLLLLAGTGTGAAWAADGDVDVRYELKPPTDAHQGTAKVQGTLRAGDTRVKSELRIDPRGQEGVAAGMDLSWELPSVGPLRNVAVGDGRTAGAAWSTSRRLTGVRVGGAGELKPMPAGATDYRIEVGRLRDGADTLQRVYVSDYESAAWRTGFGGWVTVELRGERTGTQSTHGVEMLREIGGGATVQALAAQSEGAGATGQRWGLRLAQPGDRFRWGVGYTAADRDFRSVAGGAEAEQALRLDTSVQLNGTARAEASITRKRGWDAAEPESELAVGTQMRLARRMNMRLDFSRRFSTDPSWRAGVSMQVPFE